MKIHPLALVRNQVDNKSRFINEIQDEIKKVKDDPERRRSYMKFETLLADARYDGRQEGKEEGKQEEKLNLIHGLLRHGQTREQVIDFLVKIIRISPAQAEKYYKRATTH